MKFIYLITALFFFENLYALNCNGKISQQYEINHQIHDQLDLEDINIIVSFNNDFSEINFDSSNQLRINNENIFKCVKNNTAIECSKNKKYRSEKNDIDPQTGFKHELTAESEYSMMITFAKSKYLTFNHLINSDVTDPQIIHSKEIASGKFTCE